MSQLTAAVYAYNAYMRVLMYIHRVTFIACFSILNDVISMANDSYEIANDERAMNRNRSGQLKWLTRTEWTSGVVT